MASCGISRSGHLGSDDRDRRTGRPTLRPASSAAERTSVSRSGGPWTSAVFSPACSAISSFRGGGRHLASGNHRDLIGQPFGFFDVVSGHQDRGAA